VGLILDSSVVISGERRGHTVRQILEQLQSVATINARHFKVIPGLAVVAL